MALSSEDASLAEDRFHINLPSDVDQYTGVPLAATTTSNSTSSTMKEEEELPEDRFHRKDASSAFILEQRAQSLKDKADKFERYVTLLYIVVIP